MLSKFFIFIIGFLLSVEILAKEIFFADNEQISVSLSNKDINKILVKGDKIQSLNGPAGLYTTKNDITGSVYISLSGDTQFTLFISTANGRSLSLLVSPKQMAGSTIILSSEPEEDFIALMEAMMNNKTLENYSYKEEKESKKTDFYNIADIRPIASYSGSCLVGIVSEIKNKTKKSIILKPSYFYKPGVRAVSLTKQEIAAAETGYLYQVILCK